MSQLKSKNKIISKILVAIFLVLAIFLVGENKVNAASYKNESEGTITVSPLQYLTRPSSSDFDTQDGKILFCSDHGTIFYRVKTKGNAEDYAGMLESDNWTINEENVYQLKSSPNTEQSIAAGYYAFSKGEDNKNRRESLKTVLWSSGQWATLTKTASTNTMPSYRVASINPVSTNTLSSVSNSGYVSNLTEYLTEDANTANVDEDLIAERAEAWANFYYKVLCQSGGKLNIQTSPTNKSDLSVLVDQDNRTYTQGPYKADIVDGNGNIITNQQTEHYTDDTLGTLIYNEILGDNLGNDLFKFCDIGSTSATVTYTNGETENYSVEVINNLNKVVKFPEFGKEFFLRINVPQDETRTVKNISYNFSLNYYTKFNGKTDMYSNKTITTELNNVTVKEWANSEENGKHKTTRGQTFITNYSVGQIGVNNETELLEYLKNLIINSEDAFDTITEIITGTDFDAWIEYNGAGKNEINSLSELQTYCSNNGLNYNTALSNAQWYYTWGDKNPIIIEQVEGFGDIVQSVVQIDEPTIEQDSTSFSFIGADCTMSIGGKVWVDEPNTKESKLNGRLNANEDDNLDYRYAGMLVDLYLQDGGIVASTTTNDNGSYRFDNLNSLEKYIVRFTYNGQIYEDTYYKEDLSGGYSNARDVGREAFNEKFTTINSSPNNYNSNGTWNQAYALETKLKRDDGSYIDDGSDALTFIEVWNQFVQFAKETKSYNSAYTQLESWMSEQGVGSTDRRGVIQYIKDCMIVAEVRALPEYNQFVIKDINNPASQPEEVTLAGQTWKSLYTAKSDQSRNVDFGIYTRDTADLAIQKDVYKATVRVNGKTQEYMYNQKDAHIDDDGTWNITVRAADVNIKDFYNGTYKYSREIRKSEYLYNGSIYGANGATNAKDLQVYVTYRIVVRNQSQSYDTAVNEIVDYYDNTQYEFDANNSIISSNTYIGNRAGERKGNLNVSTSSSLGNSRGDTTLTDYYSPLYLAGITDENGNDRLQAGGGMTYIYLTFKVKTHTDENGMDGRVQIDVNVSDKVKTHTDENGMDGRGQIDVNVSNGEDKGVGKRNLAEINGYSTYYKYNRNNTPAYIPDYLDQNDTPKDSDVSGKPAGLIDMDSNPGNLTSQDLNENGDLIVSENPLDNRTEDDTDKAPNIKLVFPESDADERTFNGYVYEDGRDTASEKAVVGNGKYDDGEAKINGVTVQLVELVQEVNADGSPTGNYLGEYVWNAKTYSNGAWSDVNSSNKSDSTRYYSGQNGTISPILSGPGATAVTGTDNGDGNNGQYVFKAIPAGDFFIRFIYGDTTQTTLTNGTGEGKEVVDLLNGVSADNTQGFISTQGLNAKSYNGQDYKSTTYQAGVNQSADSYGSYNGIDGYIRYEGENAQNYNIDTPNKKTSDYVNRIESNKDGTNKNIMYYYNIGESATRSGISDAKDVGNIRENSNEYSRGATGIDNVNDHGTLTNRRAEILASGLKVNSTKDENEQVNMIKEFMDNTAIASQTGVINTEIEYNRTKTENQDDNNEMSYVIDDIDLGLSERPRAQLEMFKEVSNLKITLADGTILFDTNKSVTNLPYTQHEGHEVTYTDYSDTPAYRIKEIKVSENKEETPELITTYMDEELMYGARIELTYRFRIINIGEVDYMDNQFYYTGVTNNPSDDNISKTRADKVIDYVSNNIQFLPSNNSGWSIRTVDELVPNKVQDADDNLVNRKYVNTLATYNAIITTPDLGTNLLPERSVNDENRASEYTAEKYMVLSTTLTPDTGDDSMVYNNLAETVQISNDNGRRMNFSIVGNQPMADQSKGVGEQADPDNGIYTKSDLVTPTEIDADSSQQVLILPPTGANKNYTLWIVLGVLIAILIGGSVFLIKKKVLKK